MDILRRRHAPITDEAWKLIDEQAREVLASNLSARKIVDIDGPHGWRASSVNLGILDPSKVDAGGGVFYGIRKVLPLVEVRVPFWLDLWQLDDVVRGAKDPDLDPVIEAARKIAAFEEKAVYYGFPAAGIVGMAQATAHAPISLGHDPKLYAEQVARAVVMLKKTGEEPPYTLVVGPELFELIEGQGDAYPPRKQILSLIGGPILLSPFVTGGFLVPTNNEDDFELSIGQDMSVGYELQDHQKVRLYLTESFTFRVLEPLAVVAFQMDGRVG